MNFPTILISRQHKSLECPFISICYLCYLQERKFQSVVATDGCTSKVVNSYVGSGSALPAGITARLTTAVNKLVSTKVIPQRDAYNVSMSSCGGMNPAAHTLCQTLRRVPLPSQAASASVSCPLVQFHADVLTTFTALPSNFLSPSVCYWTTPIADKLSNKSIATVSGDKHCFSKCVHFDVLAPDSDDWRHFVA